MSDTNFKERSQLTRALIAKGVRPTGWSVERMREAMAKYEEAETEHSTAPAVVEPTPEPKRRPVPQDVPKVEEHDDSAAQEALDVIKRALMNGGKSAPLDESRIIELIKAHSAAPRAVVVQNFDLPEPVTIESAHPALDTVLNILKCHENAYLFGPAGTGKTTLAKQAAQAFGLEFYFTGSVLQKYELTGFIDAGGEYQSTPFREAFEHGGLFLFDEMDGSAPQALIAFNAAIDNGVCAFPDKIVTMHPAFKVVAASNTQGKGATSEYTRNKLDAATLDRYVFVPVNYDERLELAIAEKTAQEYGGDIHHGRKAADAIQDLRRANERMSVGALITPRATRQLAKLLAIGVPYSVGLQQVVYNKLSDDQAAQLKGAQ